MPYSSREDAGAFDTVDFSGFFGGGTFVGDETSIVYPSRAQMQDYNAFVNSLASEPLINVTDLGDGRVRIGDWEPLLQNGVVDYSRGVQGNVKEDTTNFYGMVKFGNEFSNDMELSGNVGVRYVSTDVTGQGVRSYVPIFDDGTPSSPINFIPEAVAASNSDPELVTINNSYEYFLPSINVKWNLNEDMLIRFAASRAITRPNIADLNASQSGNFIVGRIFDEDAVQGPDTVPVDIVTNSVRFYGGNPLLEPIESTNIDLSFEWYFGDDGQFSVSTFHKDLENIIVYGITPLPSATINGVEYNETIPLDNDNVPLEFAGNTNLNDGSVTGVEFAYQQFFTDAPGLLANFGVQANLTLMSSDATALPAFEDADGDGLPDDPLSTFRWGVDELLGLSDTSYNLIGIYQDDKLEARLAYNWRSSYFSSYRDFITGDPIIQDDSGFLDGSIKYNVTDQLQLRFLASNLLEEKNTAQQQLDQAGQTYARSVFTGDRRFQFGFSWSY